MLWKATASINGKAFFRAIISNVIPQVETSAETGKFIRLMIIQKGIKVTRLMAWLELTI